MILAAPPPLDLDAAPFIAIWEVTRACGLACRHCRADAQREAHRDELCTDEGLALLDALRHELGPQLVVLTGGDPLLRADLALLIRHGTRIGLRVALTPSATPLLTRSALAELRDAGLQRLALSLDGVDAATHDGFRGVPGTFARTLELAAAARELGLETQLNTSVGRHNYDPRAGRDQLAGIARISGWLGVSLWSVFCLVPTGRAGRAMLLDADEHEQLYRALAQLALDPATPFAVKTTAGQPFARVLAQEGARRGLPAARTRGGAGINDGKGFLFIDHTGGICPSGFLPLRCGDVRRDRLADIYRRHPTFVRLRQPETFSGKCGSCPFQQRCGGSRSRAYALTGDPFASDPTCSYQPPHVTA